jgi:hypothetical protein
MEFTHLQSGSIHCFYHSKEINSEVNFYRHELFWPYHRYRNIKPLEIKIFEKEINTVLLKRKRYGTRKQKWRTTSNQFR